MVDQSLGLNHMASRSSSNLQTPPDTILNVAVHQRPGESLAVAMNHKSMFAGSDEFCVCCGGESSRFLPTEPASIAF